MAGRHVVERIPDLRGRVTRWVRKQKPHLEPVSLGELERGIRSLGIGGRDLLVHASWDGMPHLTAKPSEMLRLLFEIAGDGSTLLMPTHPPEVQRDGVWYYDVERSISRMGLLSECLRRTPGARRSPFPVAPVSAVGPGAADYTRDYRGQSKGTPWGLGSPYWELGEQSGQVLVLGIDFIRTLTLMHCAFDVLLDESPIDDFYEDVTFTVVQGGRAERWNVLRQRREMERQLATLAFRRMAIRSGTVRVLSIKGIPICGLDARAFLDWHLPIARKTGLPYWGFRRRKRTQVRAG
ncbi:MAG: AAC(3) family N-acetyltransferase [Acidobacteria bacterium]|nr:AAC(3) family N-acetyltransferase [Acidobacteriota bacterium]